MDNQPQVQNQPEKQAPSVYANAEQSSEKKEISYSNKKRISLVAWLLVGSVIFLIIALAVYFINVTLSNFTKSLIDLILVFINK